MVASIAISHGARVHVADVFGHSTDGSLAASAERIAAALDWMVANRIAVVNISVEGPNNAVLQEMVRRAAEHGHIIVAAAGNGGPAARPTFPAAFDGVLAVTAIDESDRPYVRANRGAYVDFAAHGVNVRVDVGDTTAEVSGTSFAAPVIAAQAAAHLQAPSPAESARVVNRLRNQAEDLGAPGRDNTFGWGALRD
jgi:subtilisin family serine protease